MITSVLKGFYPYFAVIAVIGIVLRIKNKEWTFSETILLVLLLGHNLLTIFQVGCFGDEWNFSRRYILPVAPLAFGWGAYVINRVKNRKMVIFSAIVCIAFLIFDAMRPGLEYLWKKEKKEKLFLVQKFSPVIKKDWNGNRLYRPELWWDEYRAPLRPLVQCEDSPAVGYYSGGRPVGADSTEHIAPDYIISTSTGEISGYYELRKMDINGKCYILRRKND